MRQKLAGTRIKAVVVRMEHVFIQAELSEEDWIRLCGRYHFGDTGLVALKKMYALLTEGKRYASENSYCPVSMYYALEGNEAIVLLTLGEGPDILKERLMKEERMSEAYMVECLATELLAAAYKEADRRIHAESGLWCQAYEFPGAQRPLEEMERLFTVLHQEEVRYNEAYALLPLKSVIYTARLAERAPKACREESVCAGCKRTDCDRAYSGRTDSRQTDNCQTDSQQGENGRILTYGYQRIFGSSGGRAALPDRRNRACDVKKHGFGNGTAFEGQEQEGEDSG